MTVELDIQIETSVPQGTDGALRVAANAVLQHARPDPASSVALAILLADDDLLHNLNRQYRSQDKTTDVLSFPFDDEGASILQDITYLGDIAISVPYARRQAEARGHSTMAELQLLTIHGMLHLLGYDQQDDAQKSEMWAVQRSLLDQLGLAHVEPTED